MLGITVVIIFTTMVPVIMNMIMIYKVHGHLVTITGEMIGVTGIITIIILNIYNI